MEKSRVFCVGVFLFISFVSSSREPRQFHMTTTLLPPSLMSSNGTTGNSSVSSSITAIPAQIGLIEVNGDILVLKAVVIQTVGLVLFIVFLLAGIAYFAYNVGVISCTNARSSLGNTGGGIARGSLNPFSRNGYDYESLHSATSAVYNSIEDGQKKYT